jgi:hypothetical protein
MGVSRGQAKHVSTVVFAENQIKIAKRMKKMANINIKN